MITSHYAHPIFILAKVLYLQDDISIARLTATINRQ